MMIFFVSGSHDKTIKIWNTHSYECTKTLEEIDSVYSLILVNNALIFSNSLNTRINIWNTTKDYQNTHISIRPFTLISLLSLKNGSIACGTSDNSILILDGTLNYKCLGALKGHQEIVNTLLLLSNGCIASGSSDCKIKIWDPAQNYKCVKTLNGHSYGVYSLVLLDGDSIASGSYDSTIRIWNSNREYVCTKTFYGNNSINCILLLNDKSIASGLCDKTIGIWE